MGYLRYFLEYSLEEVSKANEIVHTKLLIELPSNLHIRIIYNSLSLRVSRSRTRAASNYCARLYIHLFAFILIYTAEHVYFRLNVYI